MSKGFHAIALYLLLVFTYSYLLINFTGLIFLIVVFGIAFCTGKVVELIPSYEFLIEIQDKFWMKMFTFMSVIIPGIICNGIVKDHSVTQLGVIAIVMILMYVVPCVLMYKYKEPELTYQYRLKWALRYPWKSKIQILEKMHPNNQIQVIRNENGQLEGYVIYPEIMKCIQVSRLDDSQLISFIPINLDNESYAKVKWTVDGSLPLNDLMAIEFERVWKLVDITTRLRNRKDDVFSEEEIFDAMSVIKDHVDEVTLVDKYEFNRLNFNKYNV